MNFGEELGYWYLRLNGFFVTRNFVMHENVIGRNLEKSRRFTADVDLLALRPQFVLESIGHTDARSTHWHGLFSNYFTSDTGFWTSNLYARSKSEISMMQCNEEVSRRVEQSVRLKKTCVAYKRMVLFWSRFTNE